MQRLKNILVVLMCAVWLPSSSHALLQHAGLIHEFHADHGPDSTDGHEHDSDNHEAADGKCVWSATHISVPAPGFGVRPLLLSALWIALPADPLVGHLPSGLPPPGAAPPQFAQSWHFAFRTALPARAPSLIS